MSMMIKLIPIDPTDLIFYDDRLNLMSIINFFVINI